MEIKTKKLINNKLFKSQSSGNIKDVFIEEDFLNPSSAKISICFRGIDNSGIVEFNSEEINLLYEELSKNREILKGVKVLEFKPEKRKKSSRKR